MDRANFKERKIVRDKERHYIIIKWLIPQEDIRQLNMYVPKSIKICELKMNRTARRNRFTIVARDVNTPFFPDINPTGRKSVKVKVKVAQLCPTLCDPMDWNSLRQNTGVGSLSLLQELPKHRS